MPSKTAAATTQAAIRADGAAVPQNDLERNIAMLTAPAWRPEPETYRTATLIAVRTGGIGGNYGTYPILVFEDNEHGIFAVHAFHTLFTNYLKELKPKPGETLTVYYGGTRESKNLDAKGTPIEYHHYLVLRGDGSDVKADDYSWD